jgi:hypothetical protein
LPIASDLSPAGGVRTLLLLLDTIGPSGRGAPELRVDAGSWRRIHSSHRGVLLLLVAIVREDAPTLVRRRVDTLVVPVDRFELLDERGERSMPFPRRRGEIRRRLVHRSTAGHARGISQDTCRRRGERGRGPGLRATVRGLYDIQRL